MKTLIIGGTGYIGSALYDYFDGKENHKIDSVDLEWFYNTPNNKIIDFNDIQDYSKYDNVILLAGHSSVAMCQNDMISSFNNNVRNFVNILSRLNKQKFIYASSSSVYGDTGNCPAAESWDRFRPKSYYDLTKQEIDYYASLSNIEYYGLRFGTVNGSSPHYRNDIMINKMFYSGMSDRQIEIFNSHISRPILGINDLCRAIEKILLSKKDNRGIYNLASFNMTVGNIAYNVKQCLSDDISIIDRGNIPAYNFSVDCSKFENTFDFEFKDTISSIIESFFHKTPKIGTNRNKKVSYV